MIVLYFSFKFFVHVDIKRSPSPWVDKCGLFADPPPLLLVHVVVEWPLKYKSLIEFGPVFVQRTKFGVCFDFEVNKFEKYCTNFCYLTKLDYIVK